MACNCLLASATTVLLGATDMLLDSNAPAPLKHMGRMWRLAVVGGQYFGGVWQEGDALRRRKSTAVTRDGCDWVNDLFDVLED